MTEARFIAVEHVKSSTAPALIIDLKARYAGTQLIVPAVFCSGSSYDNFVKLAELMNRHWP